MLGRVACSFRVYWGCPCRQEQTDKEKVIEDLSAKLRTELEHRTARAAEEDQAKEAESAEAKAAAKVAEEERQKAVELKAALEQTHKRFEQQLKQAEETFRMQSEQFKEEVRQIIEEKREFQKQCATLQAKLMVAEEEAAKLKEQDSVARWTGFWGGRYVQRRPQVTLVATTAMGRRSSQWRPCILLISHDVCSGLGAHAAGCLCGDPPGPALPLLLLPSGQSQCGPWAWTCQWPGRQKR